MFRSIYRNCLTALMALSWIGAGPAFAAAVASQQDTDRSAQSRLVQGTLNIASGERVVIRRQSDGSFVMDQARFVGTDATIPDMEDPSTLSMTAEPGTVVITLGGRQDTGSILKIENGLDQYFSYAGYIVRISNRQPVGPHRTSVCTVMPGKLGIEHWPEPVIQIVMGGLETVEGQAPVCESPDVNEPITPPADRTGPPTA